MLSILKTTSHNFGLAIQDQISIKHKLENIEGLPTLELDFLSTDGQDGSTVEPTERPNLHQKQQIAKNALEKKYKVIKRIFKLFLIKTHFRSNKNYYMYFEYIKNPQKTDYFLASLLSYDEHKVL